MLDQMIQELLTSCGFDFNNPSYKKLDTELSSKVKGIYKKYSDLCNLDNTKPIYSKNGVLIANSFDRIVIGDYGPYIEFTKEQSNSEEYIIAPGQEYRLTNKYHNTIKYEWYTSRKNDCKIYWQLRKVVYADYQPERYYISLFEVVQSLEATKKLNKPKRKVRIIIAGGRDFSDYELLKRKVDHYLSDAVNKNYVIEIVSGKAKGADFLGEKYAHEKGYSIASFPAQWDKYKKRAGYIRNAEMADNADALIAFWDKSSKGTKHMIDLAKEKQLHVRIVNY